MKNDEKESTGRRCAPLPNAPDEDLLLSGVAVLTGGRDALGLPLITFPTETQSRLQNIKTSSLCQLIKYYISITKPSQRLNGFVFLADLKLTPATTFTSIIETLEALQKENRGCVAVFYLVQPKAKESLKQLKRLLGIKEKKKRFRFFAKKAPSSYEIRNENNCIFKSILLPSQLELYRYFDRPQLTRDFGGSMTYVHESWVQYRQTVESMFKDIDKVFETLHTTQDKIELLKDYDIPESEEELTTLLGWIRNRYNEVMRELNIEPVIEETKGLLEKCSHPDRYAIFSDVSRSPMLVDTAKNMEKQHKRLVTVRSQLHTTWQQAESRLVGATTLRNLRGKADKTLTWISEVGLPKVQSCPMETASTLSQAETNKNHFETGFYTRAKDVLREADEQIDLIYKATMEVTSTEIQETLEFLKHFQAKVADFRFQLEKRFQMYLDIFHFYLLTGKITRWYRRTLGCLPVKFLDYYSEFPHDAMLPLNENWNEAITQYLDKHPAPREEHVEKVRSGISLIKDMKQRNQTRLLVYRIGLLRCLLVEGKITVGDYRQLLQLQQRIKSGYDDLKEDNPLSRSMPDIAHLLSMPPGDAGSTSSRASRSRPGLSLLNPDVQMESRSFTLNTRRGSHQEHLLQRPHSTTPFIERGLSTSTMTDFDEGLSEHSRSLRRQRVPKNISASLGDELDMGRPRAATLDYRRARGEYVAQPSFVRKVSSQPSIVNPLALAEARRELRRPQPKQTPGRRFVKARDQKGAGSKSNPDILDAEHVDLVYNPGRRTFSFHRNPVDADDYTFNRDSDGGNDSVFSSLSTSTGAQEQYGVFRPADHMLPFKVDAQPAGGDVFFASQSLSGNPKPQRMNPLYSSLPNIQMPELSLHQEPQENYLALTQANLDRITQSDLTQAEKLNLMAAMLDNEELHSSGSSMQGSIRSEPYVGQVYHQHRRGPNHHRLTPEEQNIVQEILAKQDEEKQRQERYYREALMAKPWGSDADYSSTASSTFSSSEVESRLSAFRQRMQNYQTPTETESVTGSEITGTKSEMEEEVLSIQHRDTLRSAPPLQTRVVQGQESSDTSTFSPVPSTTEDEPLAYAISQLSQPVYSKKDGGQFSQSESEYSSNYGSDGYSQATSLTAPTDTDRGFYGNSYEDVSDDSGDHKSQVTIHTSDWVQRYDKKTHQTADSGYAGNEDLSEHERDTLADLQEIESVLKNHAFHERHKLIEQSRNRMLRDLLDMDLHTNQEKGTYTDAFYY